MNTYDATLITKIAVAIRPLKRVCPYNDVSACRARNIPPCFIAAAAVKFNLINPDFAEHTGLAYSWGFAKYFGVTPKEAETLIYLEGYASPHTGEHYYQAAKTLLTQYGYNLND